MLIPYREKKHGGFDEEWPRHQGANDWWYITGYLKDAAKPDNLYCYQFTVFNPRTLRKKVYVLHLTFSDLQTGQHKFVLKVRPGGFGKIKVGENSVAYLPYAWLGKKDGEMALNAAAGDLKLNLVLQKGKGAFWHGENGVLAMGLPADHRQRTVYYSYTNMPTAGTLIFKDGNGQARELKVTGKSWFDRQWGPFRLFDAGSFWEWFSIRFFDDEEVMLFAFPQHPYVDGTFITKEGQARRINNFKYNYHTLKQKKNILFSYGWDVEIPGVKDGKYRIIPVNDGQYNGGYFEIFARVTKTDGTEVGYCLAELLPGVRQPGKKFGFLNMVFAQLNP